MSRVNGSEERNYLEHSTDRSQKAILAAKQSNSVSITCPCPWALSWDSYYGQYGAWKRKVCFVFSSTALGRCCLDVPSHLGFIQQIITWTYDFLSSYQ